MLKRKCHNYGEAIRVVRGLIILCKCIDGKEIESLLDELRFRQSLPYSQTVVTGVPNADL